MTIISAGRHRWMERELGIPDVASIQAQLPPAG
jgi:hypothetical protein